MWKRIQDWFTQLLSAERGIMRNAQDLMRNLLLMWSELGTRLERIEKKLDALGSVSPELIEKLEAINVQVETQKTRLAEAIAQTTPAEANAGAPAPGARANPRTR